jgi:hypothetical protein
LVLLGELSGATPPEPGDREAARALGARWGRVSPPDPECISDLVDA